MKIILLIYILSIVLSFFYVRKLERKIGLREGLLWILTLTPVWNTIVSIIYIKEQINNLWK